MGNNTTNYLFRDKNLKKEKVVDFVEFGRDILSDHELTDRVYSFFLSLMNPLYLGDSNFKLSDMGLIRLLGAYIPCVQRIAYTNSVDLNVDGLPGIRIVVNPTDDCITMIRPVKRFPKSVGSLCLGHKYKYIGLFQEKGSGRGVGKGEHLDSLSVYFNIKKDGTIVQAIDSKLDPSKRKYMSAASILYPALTANIYADRKYHWLVNTDELIDKKFNAYASLGVDIEHIKSLFYARTLPLTETGRKRPILHWVRAHERRLKSGIDIDVRNHLRGRDAFTMHGLDFEIVQPNKKALHNADIQTVNEAFKIHGKRPPK